MSQILHEAFGNDIDIRDLILQKESTQSVHSSDEKRNPDKIADNYEINESQSKDVKKCIVIFDDILTTGAHYKAAESVLSKKFPNNQIKGLFIARRVFDRSEENGDIDIFKLNIRLK